MARKRRDEAEAASYRHDKERRLNNPEAGNLDLVPKVKETAKAYCWDPRESPQLVWAGKAGLKKVEVEEQASFEVPIVNLHIHERVAPEAIVRAVRREDAQRSLFADPELDGRQELQFYQHEVNWANRLILGDSLQVMNSLLVRESMRGKVQMIYIDPPYGIKFGSNFQPRIDKRDVKDGADDDMTREVEQVQAFRDTWELGVHSYLSYLRDRLVLARELLADSGSVFVQIGDENVHRVRCLMDEVFGEENVVSQIVVQTTSGAGSPSVGTNTLAGVHDTLLWYARSLPDVKYRQLYYDKAQGRTSGELYQFVREEGGRVRRLTTDERTGSDVGARLTLSDLTSQSSPESATFDVSLRGQVSRPGKGGWKTNAAGMQRLLAAQRVFSTEAGSLRYIRFYDDFPAMPYNNVWSDVGTGSFTGEKCFVVQTNTKVLDRCILMTTDPGDLVLDPTCGSGTTAYVAEQWGRRWITCDTSRVALAIARHRLMTASFDYYTLRHRSTGVSGGFKYKTVPHITLKSIAQNAEIDTIAARFHPLLDACRTALNGYMKKEWEEWQVPREREVIEAQTLPSMEWAHGVPIPDSLEDIESKLSMDERLVGVVAFDLFWSLKREMQARIDASIQRNAPQEELVDQPEKESGVVRVSGPFTVEAVPNVSELTVEVDEKIFGDELQMTMFEPVQPALAATNVSAYLSDMLEKLRRSGVVAKGKGRLTFSSLRPLDHEVVHAEGVLECGDSSPLLPAVKARGTANASQSGDESPHSEKESRADRLRWVVAAGIPRRCSG